MTHQRVQLRFSKQGDLRYLGHRDILRTFERLFRRSGLKMRMSVGFHPKAKMSFPLALAVGVAGDEEVVEIELDQPLPTEQILEMVRSECPPGLDFHEAHELSPGEKNAPAELVTFEMPIPGQRREALQTRIDALLESQVHEISRDNRKKTLDIRPLIESLVVEDDKLVAKLHIGETMSVRPRELLTVLGVDDLESHGFSLTRTRVELRDLKHLPRKNNTQP